MNKDKKMQIAKSQAFNILTQLKDSNCFDGFITRFYTYAKCTNYLNKIIPEYFKYNKLLLNWNSNTWTDMFDDKYLLDALVWYMQDFNLAKEIEENESK